MATFTCPFCHNEIKRHSRHHLYPKTSKPKVVEEFVDACKPCHKWLHMVFSNETLRTLGPDQLFVRLNYRYENGDREYGKR